MAWMLLLLSLLALLLTGLWRLIALRYRLLDIPNTRSSHEHPVPLGGGVIVVLLFLSATSFLCFVEKLPVVLFLVVLGGGGAVALIGLLDDLRPIAAGWRFIVHAAAAVLAVVAIGLPSNSLQADSVVQLVLAAAMVVAAVWHLNLFNFMDGIDGLAGAQTVFVTTGAAVICWAVGRPALVPLLASLGTVTLGFLVWNWPPAKVFMGDTGSGFIGFLIAVFALYPITTGILPVWTWVILTAAFVVDASMTLVRRLLRGRNIYQAHRSHAYQKLARRFNSHGIVTVGYTVVNAVWLFPFALASALHPESSIFLAIVAVTPVAAVVFYSGAGSSDEDSTPESAV